MRSYREIKHLSEVINEAVKKKTDDEVRYCRVCQKPETKAECSYGPMAWTRFSVPIKSVKK